MDSSSRSWRILCAEFIKADCMKQLFLITCTVFFLWLGHAVGQSALTIPPNARIFNIGADTSNHFPTIRAASLFIDTARITRPFVFLLRDSVYPLDTATISFGFASNMTDTGSIILQPANGVHVRFENPSWRNQAVFLFPSSWNFKFLGRSPDSSGTITIVDQSGFAKNVITLTATNTRANIRTEISHLLIRATQVANGLTAIRGSLIQNQRMVNLVISNNRFEGLNMGVFLSHNLNPFITQPRIVNNHFGGTLSNYLPMSGAMFIGSSTSAEIVGNTIAYVRNPTDFRGIFLSSTSATIEANRIHHIQVTSDAELVGIGTQLSANALLVNNVIHSFSIQNASIFRGITAISSGGGPISMYNNTISLSDTGTSLFADIIAVRLVSQNSLHAVVNNIIELKTRPQFTGRAFVYFTNNQFEIARTAINPNNNVYLAFKGTNRGIGDGNPNYVSFQLWRNGLQQHHWNKESVSFADSNRLFSLVLQPNGALVPDSLLANRINDMGMPVNGVLGRPLFDLNGQLRPAFGGIRPDPGAFEFHAANSRDVDQPMAQAVQSNLNELNYHAQSRTLTVAVSDTSSGVKSVQVMVSCNDSIRLLHLTRVAGTAYQGTWQISLPFVLGRTCSADLWVTDSTDNRITQMLAYAWEDARLSVQVKGDTLLTQADSARFTASSPQRYPLKFTELMFFRTGIGAPASLPAHLPADLSYALEITNMGNDTLSLAGVTIKAWYQYNVAHSCILPAGARLNPKESLVVGISTTAQSPGFYALELDTIRGYRWWVGSELEMYDADGHLLDYVPMNFHANNPAFSQAWQGIGLLMGGIVGAGLAHWDLNNERAWRLYDRFTPSLGTNHLAGLRADSLRWQWHGDVSGNKADVVAVPRAAGLYQSQLTMLAGTAQQSDTLHWRVSGAGSLDFMAPGFRFLQSSPQFHSSCNSDQRFIHVHMADTANGSGIAQMQAFFRVDSQFINATAVLDSGTVFSGRYRVDVPALPRNKSYQLAVIATDSSGNKSDTAFLMGFTGRRHLISDLGADTTLIYGANLVRRKQAFSASRQALQLTEFVFQFGSAGSQSAASLPAGLNNLSGQNDVLRITNLGRDSLHTNGIRVSYTAASNSFSSALPNVVLAPQQDLYLVFGGGISTSPSNRVFVMPRNAFFEPGSSGALVLTDTLSGEVLSALVLNGYQLPPTLQIPPSVWSGTSTVNGGTSGAFRISLQASASAWQAATSQQPTRLGAAIPLVVAVPLIWLKDGQVISQVDSINLTATSSGWITVQSPTMPCFAADSMRLTVLGGDNEADLAIESLLLPPIWSNNATIQPSIRLLNLSAESVSRIGLQAFWNQQLVTSDFIATTLMGGDTLVFTFNQGIDLSDSLAGRVLCIRHLWAFDPVSGNNEKCIDIGTLLGVKSPQTQPLLVYPNPAQDVLNIQLPIAAAGLRGWQVYDQLGRQVLEATEVLGNGEQLQLATTNLANGHYLLVAKSDQAIWQARFVVRH